MKLITPDRRLYVPRHLRGLSFFSQSRLGLLAAGTPITKADGTPIVCSDNVTPAVANGTSAAGCCSPPPTCASCTSPQSKYLVTISGATACTACYNTFGSPPAWQLTSGTPNGTYCVAFSADSGTFCTYIYDFPAGTGPTGTLWSLGGCSGTATVVHFDRLAMFIANTFATVEFQATSGAAAQLWCAQGTASQPVDCNHTFTISTHVTGCGYSSSPCAGLGLFTGGTAVVTPNGC